ncbi:unnamed protein product [Caenorhabditis auriculariae]|uniref:MPN domain-containing protein n=1 Tax=Caenorhabditis auriculariae TaxID=2777116 RepID=A0A8S1HHH3_9PELO|nr:unnamed protein product [Caenorhabditis auriculariae]
MERLLRELMMGQQKEVVDNESHPDTAETVNISALALIKMLRHARSGVPLEVMGLMLGSFVDDYTINVVDVFAMPQSGTSVTVESVDPVYQTKHMDLLKLVGRTENVVGWYHSHPGFGCWLSSVDVATQQSFEALHQRAVAVVVDPIQSVKGKVMLDAFRSINPMNLNLRAMAPTAEPRQTTSNLGGLVKPSLISIVHGLNTKYYSLNITYQLSSREQNMLTCMNKKSWVDGMNLRLTSSVEKDNDEKCKAINSLLMLFSKELSVEESKNTRETTVKKYGQVNAKNRLEEITGSFLANNMVQQIGTMINAHSIK